jgi:hypothetical protein
MDHDGAAKLDGDIVRFRVGANGVAMVQSGACMPANRSGKAILCRSVMPCLVPVKPIRKAATSQRPRPFAVGRRASRCLHGRTAAPEYPQHHQGASVDRLRTGPRRH